ncbi:MAG: LacI family DNA-binding transcriptional regulator [Oceanipulchritudo sp.]
MPKITIRNIAKETGLSPATVSLSLRGNPRIPRETRERVVEAASRIGYRPTPAIAQLMSHIRSSRKVESQTTVAFLNAGVRKDVTKQGGYAAELFEGIRDQAGNRGYNIDVFWLKEKNMSMQRVDKILQSRAIQGLIIPPIRDYSARLELDWDRFTAVTVGYSVLEPRLNRIVGNQRQAIMTCLYKLLQTGHQRIGAVWHEQFDVRMNFICSTIYDWFQKLLPTSRKIPFLSLKSGSENLDDLATWYDRYKPDGILTHIPLLPASLREIGVEVPRDVSLVREGSRTEPTSVSGSYINPFEIGQRLMKQLDSQLQQSDFGIPSRPSTILLDMIWEDGDTLKQRGKPDKLANQLEAMSW